MIIYQSNSLSLLELCHDMFHEKIVDKRSENILKTLKTKKSVHLKSGQKTFKLNVLGVK